MLDTHAIARSLSATQLTSAQVDAITAGIAAAAGCHNGDMATKADLAALEARLTWRLVGAMAAIGAVLRFIG
ncbi:MAG: hypothetical protein F4Y45_00805 [Acidobacteria bacterium]|nr:hypothetical protein [Acidobacteriota bacterium]MYD69186.1 hypothetical protein [Acidobacteriota bacterium]MYJ04857.1 hypothetical protein [Acidobacteriota bacterium]